MSDLANFWFLDVSAFSKWFIKICYKNLYIWVFSKIFAITILLQVYNTIPKQLFRTFVRTCEKLVYKKANTLPVYRVGKESGCLIFLIVCKNLLSYIIVWARNGRAKSTTRVVKIYIDIIWIATFLKLSKFIGFWLHRSFQQWIYFRTKRNVKKMIK